MMVDQATVRGAFLKLSLSLGIAVLIFEMETGRWLCLFVYFDINGDSQESAVAKQNLSWWELAVCSNVNCNIPL